MKQWKRYPSRSVNEPVGSFAIGVDRPRHAGSEIARIASRAGALIAYPRENRMSVSRHANANSWLAPAESVRARISPSSADCGSCARANPTT